MPPQVTFAGMRMPQSRSQTQSNDEHGSDGEGNDSQADDMDLSGNNENGDAEDAENNGNDDGDNDGNGPETGLLQSRLSPIVGGLRFAHFEGTFEKLDQQLFAMRNADHPLTPAKRSYSGDQLYSSGLVVSIRPATRITRTWIMEDIYARCTKKLERRLKKERCCC